MRENHVRENVENHFVSIQHIGGKQNLADIFTKNEKLKNYLKKNNSLFPKPTHSKEGLELPRWKTVRDAIVAGKFSEGIKIYH